MDSSPPLRRRTNRLLWLGYLPITGWSLVASGWTLWHSRLAIELTLVWLGVACLWGLFVKSLLLSAIVGALLASHVMGAIALNGWLGLSKQVGFVFLVACFLLVGTILLRALIASGSADYPYDE